MKISFAVACNGNFKKYKHLSLVDLKHFSLHCEIIFLLKLRFCFSTIVNCSSLHVLICHDVVKCCFLPVAGKPVLEIRIHFSTLEKKPLKTDLSMVTLKAFYFTGRIGRVGF